jgi:hypothetical protein
MWNLMKALRAQSPRPIDVAITLLGLLQELLVRLRREQDRGGRGPRPWSDDDGDDWR